MPAVKFFGRTAAPTHQRQGQRVAQGHLQGGGRGGGAVQRVGFRHKRQQKEVRGVFAEQAVRVARYPYQGDVAPGRIQDDVRKFRRVAGIGKGQNSIVGGQHPQVSVAGFAGVDEIGGGTRGCQCCRHLAGHMPAFAHARDCDTPFYIVQTVHNFTECGSEAVRQQSQGVCFLLQYGNGESHFIHFFFPDSAGARIFTGDFPYGHKKHSKACFFQAIGQGVRFLSNLTETLSIF